MIQCITHILVSFIFTVRGNCESLITVQFTYLCALKRTHSRQRDGGTWKLSSQSNGLKALQDGYAGRVPHVKNLTCKLNFTSFNFAVWPQPQKPQKLVDHENFLSYSTTLCQVFKWHKLNSFCGMASNCRNQTFQMFLWSLEKCCQVAICKNCVCAVAMCAGLCWSNKGEAAFWCGSTYQLTPWHPSKSLLSVAVLTHLCQYCELCGQRWWGLLITHHRKVN